MSSTYRYSAVIVESIVVELHVQDFDHGRGNQRTPSFEIADDFKCGVSDGDAVVTLISDHGVHAHSLVVVFALVKRVTVGVAATSTLVLCQRNI